MPEARLHLQGWQLGGVTAYIEKTAAGRLAAALTPSINTRDVPSGRT